MKWKLLVFSIVFLVASLPLFAQDDAFVKEQIEQGYKYYEERDYYSSLDSFWSALEHEPRNIEARIGKLSALAELGRKKDVQEAIDDIWHDLDDKDYKEEHMLSVLRAQSIMYMKTYEYDSALYWLDILEQQDSGGLYAEEISDYRKQIRDEKLVLDDIVVKHDYSFLKEKTLMYPHPQFSLLVKTLLPSKCYEMPFFSRPTTRQVTRALSSNWRWEVLEDRLVVIEGFAYREGTMRALLLFDIEERQGAVLLWYVRHSLYIFHRDKEFFSTDMRKRVVNDWIARIDMLYASTESSSSPTIDYIFRFSE